LISDLEIQSIWKNRKAEKVYDKAQIYYSWALSSTNGQVVVASISSPRYHYAQRRHITKAIVLRWTANLLHIECIIATVQRNSILQEKIRMTRCSEMAGVRVSRAFQEKRICSSGPPCLEKRRKHGGVVTPA
jgi:hypothetical protein